MSSDKKPSAPAPQPSSSGQKPNLPPPPQAPAGRIVRGGIIGGLRGGDLGKKK